MTPEQRKEAVLALVDAFLDMVTSPDDPVVNAMETDILNVHLVDMDLQTLATCAAVGAGLMAAAHGEHERRGLT